MPSGHAKQIGAALEAELSALLEPNPGGNGLVAPLFPGPFLSIERRDGFAWLMIGDEFFARVSDERKIPAFWQAYGRGLAAAREVGRQGIG